VHTNSQSAFRSLTIKFENVVFDAGGAGDHVLVQGIKVALPWMLPQVLIKDLVVFAVSRINIHRSLAVRKDDETFNCPFFWWHTMSKRASCYPSWKLVYFAVTQHYLSIQNTFFQWQVLQLPKIGQD
jgi:hypothetical protein